MPSQTGPPRTGQLDLIKPGRPGPDPTALPKEALERAAHLMARLHVPRC